MGKTRNLEVAGGLAGLLSAATLVACLVAVPSIVAEIGELRRLLDSDMSEFRALADDAWRDMRTLGASPRARRQAQYYAAAPPPPAAPATARSRSPPPSARPGAPPPPPASVIDFSRAATASSQCQCEARPNNCPAGPPGPKGESGKSGPAGPDGVDGQDGSLLTLPHLASPVR